jgi:deoxyribodipyrimidine photolyase-related protein
MAEKVFLIFPHQLFKNVEILHNYDSVYLIEEPIFFYSKLRPLKFHKLKLLLHRASMRYYLDYLKDNGVKVTYVDYSDKKDYDFLTKSINSVSYYDVVDHLLQKKIAGIMKKRKVTIEKIHDTPNFICNTENLEYIRNNIFKNKKHISHVSFYTYMRKQFNILLNNKGNYVGNQLSFDDENRQSLPKNKENDIPKVHFKESSYVDDAKQWVEKHFSNHYGDMEHTSHMTFTHEDAEKMLNDFVNKRLEHFGDYQDAISITSPFVYHSLLSHAINIGLLDPMYCINKVIKTWENDKSVGLNNVEGFVRQILGWREYTRYLYVYHYDTMVNTNFMKSKNKMSHKWYSGETGWKPVDDTIKTAFKYGYLHHIQRLMIMGNIMNLMKFNPYEVYKWFMEFAIDSYDWVMISNVYSMALFADGGLTTTKPYISSDTYIIKMSGGRYKKDGLWDVDMKTLFYNFIATAPIITKDGDKYNYFETNGRTIQMYRLWERKTDEEKRAIKRNAKEIIKSHQ